MHVSETPIPRGAKPHEHYHEGDAVRTRILRIDDAEMKVGLSGLSLEEAAPVPVAAETPAAEPATAPAEEEVTPAAPKARRTRKKAEDASHKT
jgi:predicted RNA-binding protein with RPS1 domain